MPLAINEITIGAIAYFDVNTLNPDPLIIKSGDPVSRSASGNQFVCYKVVGAESYWAPLTGSSRPERLPIDPAWVKNPYGALAAGKVSLQDGKNTYHGPSASFVAADVAEQPFFKGRPIISGAGIAAIKQVIGSRGGAL